MVQIAICQNQQISQNNLGWVLDVSHQRIINNYMEIRR